MGLRARTFMVVRGDRLDEVGRFLTDEIGLDGWLIDSVQAVPINEGVTKVTVLYRSEPDYPVEYMSPPNGGVFTTGVGIDHAEFLFSLPVDPSTILSGAVKLNDVGLAQSRLDLDQGGYLLHVNLSGLVVQGFNELFVDSNVLRFTNNREFPYSQAAGFVIHRQSSAHLGQVEAPAVAKRRGRVEIKHLPLDKSTSPQRAINQFLVAAGLTEDRLIAFTACSRADNLFDVYFLYFKTFEPQLVSGFPLVSSLFPDVAAPDHVTLVFREPIDADQVQHYTGLFAIQNSFTGVTPIVPADIDLLDGGRVVRIRTHSLFTSQGVYNIQLREGLRSADGTTLVKPQLWPIVVDRYEPGSGTFSGTESLNPYGGITRDGSDRLQIQPGFGFTMPATPGGPININIGSGLTGSGVGGPISVAVDTSTVRITGGLLGVVQTGIDHGSIFGLGDDDHTQYVPTTASRGFSAPVSGRDPTQSYHLATRSYVDAHMFTGTGSLSGADPNAHYVLTQADPLLPNATVLTGALGVAVHEAGGVVSVTGELATSSSVGVASFGSLFFTVTAGDVAFNQGSIQHQSISGAGTHTHAQIDAHINAFVGHGVSSHIVGEDDTQTLKNKTLTLPTIGSFANALHTHLNAAGGGTLDAAAIASGTIATARLGAGTADLNHWLRGDQVWATLPTYAPLSASYLVVSADGTLTNERALAAGTGIRITDLGTSVVVDVPPGAIAASMFENIAGQTLLGNTGSSAGGITAIQLGYGLGLSGDVLSVTGSIGGGGISAIEVYSGSTLIGARDKLAFYAGANVALNLSDNGTRIAVEINAGSGLGGGTTPNTQALFWANV